MKADVVLQAILDEKGITHVRLAKDLGVVPQTVDDRCTGGNTMKIETMIKTYAAVGYKLMVVPMEGEGPEYELSM